MNDYIFEYRIKITKTDKVHIGSSNNVETFLITFYKEKKLTEDEIEFKSLNKL